MPARCVSCHLTRWAQARGAAVKRRPAAHIPVEPKRGAAAHAGSDGGDEDGSGDVSEADSSTCVGAASKSQLVATIKKHEAALKAAKKKLAAKTPARKAKPTPASSTKAPRAPDRSPKKLVSLRYPGIPKAGSANPPPLDVRGYKIYTSVAGKKWRALRKGEVVDKAFPWGTTNVSAREAWRRLVQHVMG